MPRIRDLQSGKDPKTLPFLPTKPQAPPAIGAFVYDVNNKPVRKVHVDTSADITIGDSGGDLDLDLDLDGPVAAPVDKSGADDLNLDLDDLDMPASKPAAPVNLDDDLDLL